MMFTIPLARGLTKESALSVLVIIIAVTVIAIITEMGAVLGATRVPPHPGGAAALAAAAAAAAPP